MSDIKINQYVVGPVQTNCYFVINEESKETLIIDPGANAPQLSDRLKKEGLKPTAILLTHGHFDHATAAGELAKEFEIKIYAYEGEKETLSDNMKNASWMMGESLTFYADEFLKDEQEIDLSGIHIRVLFTPGHTEGGCCYYLPYEDIVFSGDTLFCTSVGRSDLPGGSSSSLIRSIREKLMVLPERTTVYPGHGEITSIENERMYNPYL